MEINNYLRLALMFGENKASTFNKNLEKMIALVLNDKYSKGLTISEIISSIKNKYILDFTDTEIRDAIKQPKQKRIIELSTEDDISLRRYSITPEEHERIRQKTDDTRILQMLHRFLEMHKDIAVSEEEFENLLFEYLYGIFNSNAETILALMSGDNSKIILKECEYNNEQKRIINEFVYWDDKEKDECVFSLISCCFDYCMMTVRKDKNTYSHIFNKKKFYLDTNIIFRLMGLNNENRRQVIDAFVVKCKEVGVELLYSNYTKKELYETIDYYVRKIKNLLNNSEPLSIQAMACLDDRMSNSDFYVEYVNWTKNPVNRFNDYISFASDLKRKAGKILSSFRQVNFDNYENRRKDKFLERCESLKEFKLEHSRTVYEKSIKADINNYMYVEEKNRGKDADFFSTDNYLISADHAFSGWEREVRPLALPIVVLPSVWYSIILQYTGRTSEDDYTSFTRFLNFSFHDSDEKFDQRKQEILKSVLALSEPVDIKNKMAFDIEEKLLNDYKEMSSSEVVEVSRQYIINEEIEEAKRVAEAEKEYAVTEEKQQSQSIMKDILRKQQDEEKKAQTARADQFDEIVNSLAEKKTKILLNVYCGITILGVALLLFGVAYIVYWIITAKTIPELLQIKIGIVISIIEVVGIPTLTIVWKKLFCELNKEEINKRVKIKLEKRYNEFRNII